jgi:DNA-binding NarL/FixJ family response regulator
MLDVEMPEMDGPQTAAILKVRYPEIRTIIITQYDEESLVEYMIKKGARGYLLKNCDPEEIVDAIHSVMRTGYYFNDLISKQTIRRLMKDKEISPLFRDDIELNERELQVLRLICKENTTPEIAKQLNLGESTIKGYRESLLEKTGATNMTGLVMYAVDNGLLGGFDFDSIRKKPPEIPS